MLYIEFIPRRCTPLKSALFKTTTELELGLLYELKLELELELE